MDFDWVKFVFIGLIIVSLVSRIAVLKKSSWMALGADLGRFAIISKTYVEKGGIVEDLRPYDMASGYFYFPGLLIGGALTELIGVNPVYGITLIGFIIDFFTSLAFYLLAKQILGDKKKAVSAFLFYSFLYNFSFLFYFRGLMSYAAGILPAFLLLYTFLKEYNTFLFLIPVLGIGILHVYPLLILMPLFLSMWVVSYISLEEIIGGIKKILIAGSAYLVMISPFILKLWRHLTISFSTEQTINLMRESYKEISRGPLERVFYSIIGFPIGTPTGSVSPIPVIIGFFVLVLFYREIKHKKLFVTSLFLGFLMIFVSSFNVNMTRNVASRMFIFPFTTASALSNPLYSASILPFLVKFNIHSPINYAVNEIPNSPNNLPPPGYIDTLNFIKKEVPKNSTFLIGGGGEACVGATSSYGERIFPYTGRKIFYFTDYCWADYNKKDYRHRMDLFRRINLDPNSIEVLEELTRDYNITHVYVGGHHVVLEPEKFLESKYYKLIYNKNQNYVFKIEF